MGSKLLGGLLAVVGGAGEGKYKEEGEKKKTDAKNALEQAKLDALQKREDMIRKETQEFTTSERLAGETFKAGETDKGILADDKRYERSVAEDEVNYQRRKGESDIEYKRRVQEEERTYQRRLAETDTGSKSRYVLDGVNITKKEYSELSDADKARVKTVEQHGSEVATSAHKKAMELKGAGVKPDYSQENQYTKRRDNILELYKGGTDIDGIKIPPMQFLQQKADGGDAKAIKDLKAVLENDKLSRGGSGESQSVDYSQFGKGGKVKDGLTSSHTPILKPKNVTTGDTTQKPDGLLNTDPITQMSSDEIKNIYRTGAGDELGTTPITALQKLLKTDLHPTNAAMPGEGDNNSIEMTLRTLGIETDLQKQKVIAEMLREKFPDATEEQIVEMIKNSNVGF
jgi:hypothetical protein